MEVTPLCRVNVVSTSLLMVISRRTGKLQGLLPSVSVKMNGSVGSTIGCLVGGAAAATDVNPSPTTKTNMTNLSGKPLDLRTRGEFNCCSSFALVAIRSWLAPQTGKVRLGERWPDKARFAMNNAHASTKLAMAQGRSVSRCLLDGHRRSPHSQLSTPLNGSGADRPRGVLHGAHSCNDGVGSTTASDSWRFGPVPGEGAAWRCW